LKQANNLLNDAGYAIQDNGQRFTLTLLLNNPLEEKIALGYKKDLKRLGINLEIRTLDTAQFYGALSTYDYDMISWRWVNSLSPGTEQAIYWGCDAAKNEGSRNYSGLCNDDIDTTIKTLTQSKTYEDLVTTTQKLDTMIMSEYPFIPLYYMGVDYVARWPYINHPNKQSTYGMVLETWWHTQE
jgi:peptide/nickel transport system substrate-binding protein